MSDKNNKPRQVMLTKETPEARKRRVSLGVSYRPVIFKDKRRQQEKRRLRDEAKESIGYR